MHFGPLGECARYAGKKNTGFTIDTKFLLNVVTGLTTFAWIFTSIHYFFIHPVINVVCDLLFP